MTDDDLSPASIHQTEAVEAERRQIAHLLNQTVISQLNLLLTQARAYEQTLTTHQETRTALSVLTMLAQQAVQQARDLEARLHPTTLESLGLEPALEMLANQERRSSGLQVILALERLRERLPAHLELTLYRTIQQIIDRATRQAHASRLLIRLEKNEYILTCTVTDDGIPPTPDALPGILSRIEMSGGTASIKTGSDGGLKLTIQFDLTPPPDLSEREMEVIQLVAVGLTNKQIAARLVISPRTVKFHLDNIFSKLGVNSRTEAAVFAYRVGWVSDK